LPVQGTISSKDANVLSGGMGVDSINNSL